MSAPETSFYVTGGTLRHDAPSYVERQADRDVFEGLLAGEFCYVLTPRQMGKSSLMVRTASKLREQSVNVIALDLTAIGQNLTAEQWYDGLVVRIGRQLKLDEEMERFWRVHERLGPCQRLFAAIRDVVLRQRPGPLAIFVDEIDSVRSLPFSIDEFFAAMRECYNRRAEDSELNRLTFCLLGVATPSDLIRDTRTTPFNIGRRIELHDFTRVEAAPLAQGLRDAITPDSGHSSAPAKSNAAAIILRSGRLLTRILHWTGGHPYLTQRFCRAVAEDESVVDATGVDRICEDLFLSSRARERDDNLLFVRDRLLRSEVDITSLLELYLKVRGGNSVVDDETSRLVSVLRLSGIVTAENGYLRERNRIYSRVFDGNWVRSHLPGADLRRQRAAFYRGVRTTAIAAFVVVALTITMVIAINQARKAGLALAESHFSQAKALRGSGLAGQRFNGLSALDKAHHYYTNTAALRDEAVACLALVDLRETTNGINQTGKALPVELSPDLGVSAAADTNGTITLRGVRNGLLLATLAGIDFPIEQLHLVPKSPYLIAEYKRDRENQVIVWDWKSGKRLFVLEQGIHGSAVAVSQDKRRLALGVSNATIHVHALPSGEKQGSLFPLRSTQLPRTPQAIEFDPSGKLLAVSSREDQFVDIWEVDSRKVTRRFYHSDEVLDVSWHPQGRLLATACSDGSIYLWNINDTKEPWKKLSGHEREILSLAFNHRGDLLASLGKDATIRLWIPATPTSRHLTVRLTEGELDDLSFSDDDRFLIASGKGQKRFMVWSVQGGEYSILQSQSRRLEEIETIDFSPDGRLFAASSRENIVLWDVHSGRELQSLTFTNIYSAGFSADGGRLLVSMDSGVFQCPLNRDSAGEEPILGVSLITRLDQLPKEVGYLAMSSGRTNAIVVHHTNAFALAFNSDVAPVLIPVGERFTKVAVHPAGTWMAGWAKEQNLIQILGLDSAKAIRSRRSIPGSECFAFSPDGEWLGLCATDGFHFYRVGEWNKIAFPLPRSSTAAPHGPLAFSRDGRILAIAFSPYDIRLYRFDHSANGEPKLLATLESPDRTPLQLLAFSPDGRHLAAATRNQIVQLWNLSSLRDGLADLKLAGNWPEYQ